MKDFKDKKVAILGFGIEGKDILSFLKGRGAKISIFDQKEEKELDLGKYDDIELKLYCGDGYDLSKLTKFDVIFRSPGVYRYLPEIVSAEEKGAKVSSATKLFFDLCPSKIVGVTGTKGKGTTSTLINNILKKDGRNVFLAGNIGRPYLEILPKLTKDSIVVLELSSFQLIDMAKSPHVAVVLNITQDHLDWHKDKEEYIDAKKSIVKNQDINDFAVINADYGIPMSFEGLTKSRKYYFSNKKEVNGSYIERGKIIINTDGKKEIVGETINLLLKGEHNFENVTAAACTAYLLGAHLRSIQKAVFSFKGLEHRLEFIGEFDGKSYYNDSFATSPQPTIAAVGAFNEPTTVIIGGSGKGLDYSVLAKGLLDKKNLENVVLIGQVAGEIKDELLKVGLKVNIPDMDKSDMFEIVKKASEITPDGGVVLLSPAAASFDMFENYKDRGNKFKEAVHKLNS